MKRIFFVLGSFLCTIPFVHAEEAVPLDHYLNNHTASMAETEALVADVEKALASGAEEAPLESVLQNKVEVTQSKPADAAFDADLSATLNASEAKAPVPISDAIAAATPIPEQKIVVSKASGKMLRYPYAVLDILNKISGHRTEITVETGKSIAFERLDIHVHSCQVRPPEMDPEEGVALKILENFKGSEQRKIFEGWMFKARKALSTMNHPLYDVWLQGCRMPEAPVDPKAQNKAADMTPGEAKDKKAKDKKMPEKKPVKAAIEVQTPALDQKIKKPAKSVSKPNLEAVY